MKRKNKNFKFELLADTSNDFITIADKNAKAIWVNKAWKNVFGELPYKKNPFKEIHPDDVKEVQNQWNKLLSGRIKKAVFEYRYRISSNKYVTFLSSVSRVLVDGHILFYIVARDVTERRKIEDSYKESNAMFKQVMELIPARIFWKDKNLKYLGCNTLFAKDAGKSSPDELIGKDDFQMGWKDNAELYRADDKKVIFKGIEKLNYEEPQTTPDGKKIWLKTSKRPLRDSNEKIIGVMGVYDDITDEKNKEEKLKDSEEKYRLIADNSTDVIYVMNLKQEIEYVSPSVKSMTGYNQEEFSKLKSSEFLTKESFDIQRKKMLKSLLKGGVKFKKPVRIQLEAIRKDGTKFWVEINARFIFDGGIKPKKILGVARDITEMKKTQESLMKSRENYKRTYEGSRDGFVLVDMSGKIVEYNQAFRKMLGYTDEELITKTYVDLTPKKWHAFESKIVKDQILPRGYSEIYEKEYIGSDGKNFPVELRTYLLKDENEKSVGMWAFVRDITEKKKAEKLIRKSEIEYKMLFDASRDVLVRLDRSGKIIAISDRVSDFGYKKEELLGKRISKLAKLFTKKSLLLIVKNFTKRMAGAEVPPYEVEGYAKDGKRFFMEISSEILRDKNGKVVGEIGTFHDVTQRHYDEEVIKKRNEELEKINNIMIGREMKMIDLKNEIQRLKDQMDK